MSAIESHFDRDIALDLIAANGDVKRIGVLRANGVTVLDSELWAQWFEANTEHPLIVNGHVFAHPDTEAVAKPKGKAKE